jgi:translation initiation factor IF-1
VAKGRRRRRFDGPREKRTDHIQVEGVINQVYAGGQFEVGLDGGNSVRAQLCGRMRKFRIRVLLGDRVTVALSPYDLTHGMIVFRAK